MPDYSPDFSAAFEMPVKSRMLYEHRRWYKEKTTQIFNQFNNNYIDLWYDVPFYGKVNRKGALRVPNKANLVYLAKENVHTFEFVAQAFKDLVFFLRRAGSQGRTSLRGFLRDFQSTSSFRDSTAGYLEYSLPVMETFNGYIITKDIMVLNFEDYINEFLKFLRVTGAIFSYYSIFAGRYTPVGSSGLAIEFLPLNHDNDKSKNIFFQHPEFRKYVNTAANFGFRINKNAPWMIIADLNSKPMKLGHRIKRSSAPNGYVEVDGYMPQHFIPSIDWLFENYYDRVITHAFALLKSSLLFGYKEYQEGMRYLVDHGKIIFRPEREFKRISTAYVEKTPLREFYIDTYKTSNSLNPQSPYVDISDIMKVPKFNDSFYASILEKILKCEFNVDNDRAYRMFRKKFDKKKQNGTGAAPLLDLLEGLYNPTKIFDPATKTPQWAAHKKALTYEFSNVMIPNEQDKPTTNKVITEFYTGF